MKRVLIYVAIGILALASGALVARLRAQPVATVPAPIITPEVIPVDTPTEVTVTVSISDARVIPTGVNLLRVNGIGSPTNLGRMYDDGTNGDGSPGDGVFSRSLTLHEHQPGAVQLQVSAAFRGILRRSLSGVRNRDLEQFDSRLWQRYLTISTIVGTRKIGFHVSHLL